MIVELHDKPIQDIKNKGAGEVIVMSSIIDSEGKQHINVSYDGSVLSLRGLLETCYRLARNTLDSSVL